MRFSFFLLLFLACLPRPALADRTAGEANVLNFGADPSGVRDSAKAFREAMTAAGEGGTLNVPYGTYRLDSPPRGTAFPNMTFRQAIGVTYTGAGANIADYDRGQWAMGHTYTNGFLGVKGPAFFCDGRKQTALLSGATESICSSYEVLSPPEGVSHQLLMYMGADANRNTSSSQSLGNWLEDLNIVNNAWSLDIQPNGSNGLIGASYVGLEIDMQGSSSSTAKADASKGVFNVKGGAIASSDVMDTGLLITGGGWPPDRQPELIGTAVNIGRSQGAWFTALNTWNSRDGLVTNAYRYPIRIDTTYWGDNSDPYCPNLMPPYTGTSRNPNPGGCPILNGIYFDNVGGGGAAGSVFQAGQLANGRPALFLTRATDDHPDGLFLDFRTHNADRSVFSVDVRGNATARGDLATHGGSVQVDGPDGRFRYVHFDTQGTARWEIGADAAAEDHAGRGSNLYVSRRNDSGAPLDDPITISRRTGAVTIGDALVIPGYAVRSLPASPVAGEITMVTDALSPAWGQPVKGGGSTRCLVLYDGSAWIVE